MCVFARVFRKRHCVQTPALAQVCLEYNYLRLETLCSVLSIIITIVCGVQCACVGGCGVCGMCALFVFIYS